MNINMRFQKKIFLLFTAIVLAVITGLATVFYFYTYSRNFKTTESYYVKTANTIAANLDEYLNNMDIVACQLTSSMEIQQNFLAAANFHAGNLNYFDSNVEARRSVEEICWTFLGSKARVRKINIFSSPCTFVTTDPGQQGMVHIRDVLADPKWVHSRPAAFQYYTVLPTHPDNWAGLGQGELVISVYRPLITTYFGMDTVAYIEVQDSYEKLAAICEAPLAATGQHVIVTDGDGSLVYPYDGISYEEMVPYLDSMTGEQPGIPYTIRQGNMVEVICYRLVENGGWTIQLIQPKSEYMLSVYSGGAFIVLICILFAVLILLVIFAATARVTRPIRELRQSVECMTLENAGIHITFTDNDEMEGLKDSFNTMIAQIMRSSALLAQAQAREWEAKFRAIQAQVNPHFLYNSMMAISAAGQEAQSEKVQIMCVQLSDIFRYVASSEIASATLREEIANAYTYLEFAKWCYEDNFYFDVDAYVENMDCIVPKLIIQPILENCFTHALRSIHPPLKIRLTCTVLLSGWTVDVCDNGGGISPDAMEKMNRAIARAEKSIAEYEGLGPDLPTGSFTTDRALDTDGMALVNIYIRLRILYGRAAVFQIANRPEGGLRVHIGGKFERSSCDEGLQKQADS